jgi:hypothetical protein
MRSVLDVLDAEPVAVTGVLDQLRADRAQVEQAMGTVAGQLRTLAGHSTRTLAGSLAGSLTGVVTGQCCRPTRPRWMAGIGRGSAAAFGQRLAFLVQHAPPYYALYGTVTAELADFPDIHLAAARFPSHIHLAEHQRARACDWRPTRVGWFDVDRGPTRTASRLAPGEPFHLSGASARGASAHGVLVRGGGGVPEPVADVALDLAGGVAGDVNVPSRRRT